MLGYCQKEQKIVHSDKECVGCKDRDNVEKVACIHFTEFACNNWHDIDVDKPRDGDEVLIWYVYDSAVMTYQGPYPAIYKDNNFYDSWHDMEVINDEDIKAWMHMPSKPEFVK